MNGRYKIVQLSDSEFYKLFDQDKKYQYPFYKPDLDAIGKDGHTVYSLQIDGNDVANLIIGFWNRKGKENQSLPLTAAFIYGFQRNFVYKKYKGCGSFLLDYIVNKFSKDYVLGLYAENVELERYYSEFGFVKCDNKKRNMLNKLYKLNPMLDHIMMVYKD